MVDDWTSVSNFLADVWQFIGGILRLDPAAFQAAILHDQDAILTLTILLLAGVSYTLGQSVVLFANRVPRRRFIFSLVMSALGLVVGVFFWSLTIWLLNDILFGLERPFSKVLIVAGLSYAPLLFGILVLLPYLGNFINFILRIWTLLALLTGVTTLYQYNLWQAIVSCIGGWLIIQAFERTRVISAIDRRLWHLITGTPRQRQTQDVVDEFVDSVREAAIEANQNSQKGQT